MADTYTLDELRANATQASDRATFAELREVARGIETALRQRLSGGHQKEIALDIGISESKMSRALTGDGGLSLSDVAMLFAAMQRRGLHVVEAEAGACIVPEEELAALTVLARKALK